KFSTWIPRVYFFQPNSSESRWNSSIYTFFLISVSHFYLALSGQVNSLESVPDLENSMYLTLAGYPCVRLLNLTGEIGCANPGREKVVAPVVRLKDVDKLTSPSAVLVSQDEMEDFFSSVLNDHHFAKKVAGVLVESGTEVPTAERGFSPVEKFPQVKFAPYKNVDYIWNPAGSNIMWNKYDFPVFLLSQDSTVTLQEIAGKNEKNKRAYSVDVTEFDLVMQTTKAGTHDSESCLRQQSCLPLGGYSVLSSLPPISITSGQPKPILLVVASMDSASFFRDKSPGADSPLSGMISLLAAVDALSHIDGVNELKKQLVFLVFTGEAWGYLGSRRFLAEVDMHSDVVHGLNSTLIELVFFYFCDETASGATLASKSLESTIISWEGHAKLPVDCGIREWIVYIVMEVGSIGKAFDRGLKSLFVHAAGGSSAANKTFDAFQHAHESLGSNIKISMASKSNPGIPPSSLMSFLRKDSSISGIVLEDFDTAFTNKFYHSRFDDLSNINSSAIVTAASLVARTLYILASDGKEANNKTLDSISVNSSLVEELVGCLLTCEPGLSCGMVKDYIGPTSNCPNHYVGVLVGEPSTAPLLDYVSDISRFVWNFLAERTSLPSENASIACSTCSKAEVCIRSEKKGKSTCVVSTTRYIPAYSTRLKFESGVWHVLPPDASDVMGMVDPVWTESFWDVIQLRVYTVQHATYDHLILLGGIAVTLLAYLAIVVTRTVVTKALKRD
ncbi:hypothetical protein IFM89_020827, partial [Coptis chinensis]